MARTKQVDLFKECDKRAHKLLKTKPIRDLNPKYKNEIVNHHLIKLSFLTSVFIFFYKLCKPICKHTSIKIDDRDKYEKLFKKGKDKLDK